MKPQPSPQADERRDHSRDALTLIEMLGVLTIMGLLAGLLVPVAIRHLDRVASDQETAQLRLLGDALQKAILRTRSIPSYTTWATVAAAQTGLNIASVTNNLRNHPRILVVDGGGWLATNLPYVQSYPGTPAPPANARVMLLSSLGKDLPIASQTLSASDFAALWNAPPGTVPWTGWSGSPDDVKMLRLSLSPLFVKLVLSTYNAATNGQYQVDSSPTNAVPYYNGFAAWFLKSTVLKLYKGSPATALDVTQILNQDSSFVFEDTTWRGTPQGEPDFPGQDIGDIVAAFLAATPNANAQYGAFSNYQQILVVSNFTAYISNYNVWAAGNFQNNSLQSSLQNIQSSMMNAVWGLYSQMNGSNYFPANASPCP